MDELEWGYLGVVNQCIHPFRWFLGLKMADATRPGHTTAAHHQAHHDTTPFNSRVASFST